MFINGIDGERPRWIRRRWNDVGLSADPQNIRRVSATRTFRMIGVNRATLKRRDGMFDCAGFVEGVGVNGDLNVVLFRNVQAAIDRCWRRAPVFV